MNRRLYKVLAWLPWLALPLTAVKFRQSWDRLPARMATHFNAAGRPNGWMPRETALGYALGLMALLLVIFTVILFLAQKRKTIDAASWALLGLFYFVAGAVYHANMAVLRYNLGGGPVQLGWIALAPVGAVALAAVYLAAQRGKPLPATQWIATETHASPFLAAVFLVPLGIELWAFTIMPAGSARFTLLAMCALFLLIAAFAWSGFQYNFGPAGVEIRSLGYRLRSIPISEINSYAIEPWNLLRGYGIRGVGRSRAYTWGNKVVHIRTIDGDVFLGHSEPERIMRDLDAIKQFAR